MKKLLYLFVVLLFTGCNQLSNTPTKRVEEFLKSYQTLDEKVLNDLDNVVNQDVTLSKQQQDTYKDIMKKHYQNLTYKIKDDTIDGNNAIVTAEITVTDFSKALQEANSYMNNNIQSFNDETGNYNITMFNDYRLEQLNSAKEKIKYTVYFSLNKQNDEWVMGNIDSVTYDKINGVYNY